jgi:hypothetical protein
MNATFEKVALLKHLRTAEEKRGVQDMEREMALETQLNVGAMFIAGLT